MTSLIKKVWLAAHQAFTNVNDKKFPEYLSTLSKLLSKLKAADVGLTADSLKPPRSLFGRTPPASYMPVNEQPSFTMGIFVVHEGASMPLHDHPQMYGLVKVLVGKLSLRSFTPLPSHLAYVVPREIMAKTHPHKHDSLMPTICTSSRMMNAESEETSLLSPESDNYHEISSADGLTAFIDILSPPYNGIERDCHYYSVVGTVYDSTHGQEITWLVPIDPPQDFWTSNLTYKGPPL